MNRSGLELIVRFLIMVVLFSSCDRQKAEKQASKHDLPTIKERGKLIALTDYNSTSYFIYRGTPMGYQYDLLNQFAERLDLDLELRVNNDLDDAFSQLNAYECDIIAINLTVTKERKKRVSFSDPITTTRQVLVQKMPDNWQVMSKYNLDKYLIRNQLDLAGKTVHVMKNSAFAHRLRNLADEIGDSIHIVEVENYEEEQLIRLVAKGEIDYTVSDEDVALLNQTYHRNLDVKTPISFPQKHAWAVNPNNKELLDELNDWISSMKGSALHAVIYKKYYKDMQARRRNTSPYLSITGGKISDYDELIKKYAKTIDWDWRLLASMMYQESRFNPNIRSWAGAYGLMQLMPATARRFGASNRSVPEVNIRAGTKFIKWLDNRFVDSIPDKDERIKFILASYNVGMGHVNDAQRLARANGKDPHVWTDNVDYFLLNKSNPQYYDSELVKYGYCRGDETYNYVKDVLERYEIYKSVIN